MISFPTVNINKSYIYTISFLKLYYWSIKNSTFVRDAHTIRHKKNERYKFISFFHISDTEYFFFDNFYEYFVNYLLIYKI